MAIGALPLPATVNGLPFHPLIVHAVVVILPLTVLGAIGISVWPAMRRHLGLLVLLFGADQPHRSCRSRPAAASSFVTGSGHSSPSGSSKHQHYAHKLLPLTAGLLRAAAAHHDRGSVDDGWDRSCRLRRPPCRSSERRGRGRIGHRHRAPRRRRHDHDDQAGEALGRLLPAGLRGRSHRSCGALNRYSAC